jgi:hypothetical protein
LRRSRGRFLWLSFRSLWVAVRLLGYHRRAAGRWRESAGTLTSGEFWGRYLQWQRCSDDPRPSGGGRGDCSRTVAAQAID